jgi:endonuclease YncB( thermonuclease family)
MKHIVKTTILILATAIPSATLADEQASGPAAAGTPTSTVTQTASQSAHCFTGTVVRVIDGDTIIVGTNRVRLAEIDAPEMKTPHGPASRRALCDLILHKRVTVTWTHRGRYGRIIGQVYLVSEPVRRSNEGEVVWTNLTMVAQGWARQFKRYSQSREIAEAEAKARKQGKGKWRSFL